MKMSKEVFAIIIIALCIAGSTFGGYIAGRNSKNNKKLVVDSISIKEPTIVYYSKSGDKILLISVKDTGKVCWVENEMGYVKQLAIK